ncbi:MAG: prenyltransferase [Mycoplasmatales bacterium]
MAIKGFLRGMYAELQIRTGFVATFPVLFTTAFIYTYYHEFDLLTFILMYLACFCLLIVANIANGIAGSTKEDNEDTINDHYKGKHGLLNGVTTYKQAYISLVIFTLLTIIFGLILVIIHKSILFLFIGIISVIAAILYSLSKMAYIVLPITEFISGFFCGFLTVISLSLMLLNKVEINIIIIGIIYMLYISSLLFVNNTCDYYKDLNHRKTFIHVIGQRNAQYFLLFNIMLNMILFIILSLLTGIYVLLIGVVISMFIFFKVFFIKYIKEDINELNNKGIKIPMYLKFYYGTSLIYTLLILLSNI